MSSRPYDFLKKLEIGLMPFVDTFFSASTPLLFLVGAFFLPVCFAGPDVDAMDGPAAIAALACKAASTAMRSR